MKTPILLIAYVFPPYPGIGGRRWAKHAIELTKHGYEIHVLCARNPFKQESLWSDEVRASPDIKLHALPAMFPKVLLRSRKGVFYKLAYNFWTRLLPFVVKGTIYDRAIFWKTVLLPTAKELIRKHHIRAVIATGGPFGALYQAALLKRKFPCIFLISDLRDPWTWGPNWGFPALKGKRKEIELFRERFVVNVSDVVTVPSEKMQAFLVDRYPACSEKLKVLPHFFDPAEVGNDEKLKSSEVRLVFYGTIYPEIYGYLIRIFAFLKGQIGRIRLDIYSDTPVPHSLKGAAGVNIKFNDALLARALFSRFKEYDYVLLVNPDYNKDNISTKFYEIIYSRTPIIVVSEPGDGPDFIVKNQLGIHLTGSYLEERFSAFLAEKDQFVYNKNFDVSAFSLASVSRKIDAWLKAAQEKSQL